ncbi:PH domain-containing protein [Micrococcus sp.]|uniref:PH domain-containing protein n=1 Tax=Micrococcus sp. TaxID=1271 RepID=UPI0026DA7D79|nr:PH domain-containing protein [Micrococcus sp.]MDO4238830.1 PH domain-containing protein [Micrococcus sp.]
MSAAAPDPQAADAPDASAATVPAAPAPGADDAGWVRVHPASPWIKGWSLVAVFLFVALRDTGERMVGSLLGVGEAAGEPFEMRALLIGGGILLGALLLLCLAFFFSWWFTRFRVGEEEIELKQGWLFRSRRQMKYDRLQAVDLQYPLLARLLGLAAVKVEAADGGDSALELAYLRKPHAAQVRREILDRASGALVGPARAPERVVGAAAEAADGVVPGGEADRAPGPAATSAGPASAPAPSARHRVRGLLTDPQDEGTVMLRVPAGRLVGSVLLSDAVLGTLAVFLGLAGIVAGIAALVPGEAPEGEDLGFTALLLASALPFVFSLAGAVWSGLNKGWGFTVRTSEDGLRLRYGLTETTSQTIPPGRVQGIHVIQPLAWRPFGWHKVKVSVAGYGLEGTVKDRDVALPVGPWEDVLRVLEVVAPDAGLDGDPRAAAGPDGPGLTPAGLMQAAMTGSGEEHGFTHVPRRARWWFNLLTWRRHGFALTRTLLVVRRGRLRRSFQALQHERVQDVRLSQGPVQRRLDVASLTVDVAGGVAVLEDLDRGVLEELFEVESRHAAVSRRLADRNRWMLPEELERFERRTAEVARTEVGRREMAAAGVVVDGQPAADGREEHA